jgi:hypothetical protein
MNLPILIQKLYGEFIYTGLYSFEFVDKNRNTITEIFFLTPPKQKTVSEPTRSTTQPTLGGNFTVDGGNATKTMTINGDLYFPYVGSPDNPVARDNSGLQNVLNGMEEYLKLRFMLIRYRDYTMTHDAKMTVPTSILAVSKEINALYKKVSQKVKNKTGALYDEIRLIVHDYDMDDHYYCRVDNFTSSQSDSKHIAISYTINLECYEPDDVQKTGNFQTKQTTNASVDALNAAMQIINFDESFDSIQAEIGYNVEFINSAQAIETKIEEIDTENENIQAGKSTASTLLPIYVSDLLTNVNTSLSNFIDTFLSVTQKALYNTGDLTIDDVVSRDLLIFYNSLQKVKLQAESLQGILNSVVSVDELRYYSDADDYTLTEEQFDSENSNKIENTTNFYYYTVVEGDTARIIAQRELNDHEQFIKILKLNNIAENDFIDNNLIGLKIKIPFPISVTARSDDNLVYESDFTDSEKFLFGSDISGGLNNTLQASETGDLLAKDGIENAYINVENRLNNKKGSLNVFNPNWGTIAIDDSNAPLMVKIDRYLSDVVSQVQSDPRVESVQMDLDKLDWNGEKISVPSKVFFIGTEETREVTL